VTAAISGLHGCAGNDNAPVILLYRGCISGSLHGPSCLGRLVWGDMGVLYMGTLSSPSSVGLRARYDRADRVTVVSVRSMSRL
jgi:hypothetical protein